MNTALEIEILELLENGRLKQYRHSCHYLLDFRKHVPAT